MKYKIKIDLLSINLELEASNENEDIFSFLNNFFDFIGEKTDILQSYNKINLKKKENNLKQYGRKPENYIENKEHSTLIAESATILQDIKKLASFLFNFTPEGEVIRKINIDKLTNIEQIIMVALERKLLFEENLIEKDTLNAIILSKELKFDKNQANARLSDLVKINLLKRVGRGEYKINLYVIHEYIKSIIEKTKNN